MTQRARVVKSHECSKVASCQRVSGTKGYELPKVANIKRYEDQEARLAKGYMFQTVSVGTSLLGRLDPGLRPDQELRMVLVKPRSREGSVSERLCNVWLDDTRDELVIVYETVKKLCIESHVSK
ncbi:hypothetical protein YC2023_004391 [Brassica napus]